MPLDHTSTEISQEEPLSDEDETHNAGNILIIIKIITIIISRLLQVLILIVVLLHIQLVAHQASLCMSMHVETLSELLL